MGWGSALVKERFHCQALSWISSTCTSTMSHTLTTSVVGSPEASARFPSLDLSHSRTLSLQLSQQSSHPRLRVFICCNPSCLFPEAPADPDFLSSRGLPALDPLEGLAPLWSIVPSPGLGSPGIPKTPPCSQPVGCKLSPSLLPWVPSWTVPE